MFDVTLAAGAEGIAILIVMFLGWILWRSRSRSPRLVRRIAMLAGWTLAAVAASFIATGFSVPTVTAAVLSFIIFVAELVSVLIGATPTETPQAPTATALRHDPPS
jgi:uncharacterized iron-regulated membrane protein